MRSAARRPELPQRLQVSLRIGGIAAVAGDHGHHGLVRRVRVGEQAHVHGQLVGGRLGEVAVEAERLAGPADGMGDHPAVHRGHRVSLVLETGGDAEVAAAAAQGPEQVRVVLGAGHDDLAVGGDDLDRQQVVDGEAVLAHQPAFPAAQGQARDTGAGDHPAGGGQPVDGRGPVELLPGGPGLGPDGPPRRIDPDPFHRRQVDHQAAVGDGQAGHVVAAAAHRYLGRLVAADGDRVHDVRDGAAPGDKRGTLVDQPVVDPADLLVAQVCRGDQLAGERRPHLTGNLDRAAHLVSPLLLPDHDGRRPCQRRVMTVSRV